MWCIVKQKLHGGTSSVSWSIVLLESDTFKLIGIFHIGNFCFRVPFLNQLLLRNCAVDFVDTCNVYVRKMIVKAAKRIFNSDKICRSYSDLNFGVTFLEHSVDFKTLLFSIPTFAFAFPLWKQAGSNRNCSTLCRMVSISGRLFFRCDLGSHNYSTLKRNYAQSARATWRIDV